MKKLLGRGGTRRRGVVTRRSSWNLLIRFRLSLFLTLLGGVARSLLQQRLDENGSLRGEGTLNLDTWPVATRDNLTPHWTVAVDPTCDTRARTFVSFSTFLVNAA